MVEVDQATNLILREDPKSLLECMGFYFKDKWVKDVYQNLQNGYDEMSQINLTLSEIGLEDDMTDLYEYEVRLIGRDCT